MTPTTPATKERKQWTPIYMGEEHHYRCSHCGGVKSQHIRDADHYLYCPEWRLRQLDGDR